MLVTNNISLKDYLYKELEETSSSLPLHIKDYLVQLLCFYLSADQVFKKKTGQTKSYECSLVELYKQTQASSTKTQEKLYIFKSIGDFSLYISGFFRSFVEKKITHVSYYEQMGKNAYSFVAKAYEPDKPNVFKELADQFKYLSEILFMIQKKSENKKDKRYLLQLNRIH